MIAGIRKATLLGFFLCAFIIGTSAHSWLQCADYRVENGRMWSADSCKGWPRNYNNAFKYASYGFGADAGYDHRPAGNAACNAPPSTGDYTTDYPKATYNPGQRVCLAWPPKNHVAANCDNPNMPDHGTRIYRSAINPTADPTLDQFHQNLVYDFGSSAGVADTGFMNCPNFCQDKGAALCTGCFVIPTDLPTGKYTFLWEWAFNTDTDLYTNCFDVDIVANSGNYVSETYKKLTADEYKALQASGQPDTPTKNNPPSPTGSASGGGGGGGSSGGNPDNIDGGGDGGSGGGMSAGGAAVLVLFIIAVVGGVVGSVLFVKMGYGTIDAKYPFYHRKARVATSEYSRKDVNYVAFKDGGVF